MNVNELGLPLQILTLGITASITFLPVPTIVKILGFSAITILACAQTFSRKAARSRLKMAQAITARFAVGDIREKIDAKPDGNELDSLFREINKMSISLTGIMGEIRGSTGVLRDAVLSFQKGNQSVTGSAEIVKSNSEAIASASELASSSVRRIRESATTLSDSIQSVAATVEEMSITANSIEQQSQESFQNALVSHEHTAAANLAVSELAELANQVGIITQTIENIASQTNLLALNATIEAASAGEAGKGFAVVAGEVKQLSRQTADATSKIRNQIESIQTVVRRVTELIQQTVESVHGVHSSSQRTMHAVGEQRSSIQELSRSISTASTSSREMVKGLGEIAIGAQETASSISMVHHNAAQTVQSIEETKTHVVRIADTSKRLEGVISSFQIAETYAEFTPALRLGIPEMDSQHQRLFDLINQLAKAVSSGKNHAEFLGIIDGLAEYTVSHFHEEENHMRKVRYHAIDSHIQIHKTFVDTVMKARKDFSEGKGMVGTDLIKFLTEWLVQHIGVQDKAYANARA